uniref:U3 small nucleolar RNAinteracting protein putative n=1 Tax=Albugo laibachii Nc14 TaxID=890382 RepID=F0W0X9_9STRA|nr:U3 small nucleolar RNAinteracting protein putative [Albugo laibachii Nc14]|eukprot:CCA14703.1 U3 small nucleolar RNAinteracting protein putative [Albugo laibachii Nc14]
MSLDTGCGPVSYPRPLEATMKRKIGARKPLQTKKAPPAKAKKSTGIAFDWSSKQNENEIDLTSESDSNDSEDNAEQESEEEIEETAQEKRIRLAKEYLDKLKAQETTENDEDSNKTFDDRIGAKLLQDAQEAAGKGFRKTADKYEDFEFDHESVKFLKGHRLSVTAVCLAENGHDAFSVSKDGAVLCWNLLDQTKTDMAFPKEDSVAAKKDHQRAILSVATSFDGKYLATGGCDRLVHIWDIEKKKLVESFSGHRDTISALSFCCRSSSLFSGSYDRTIKHWNLTEMGYVETLFGHQAHINSLDSTQKERVVSCGRDRSLRLWKIPEESQLILYGNSGSLDCVKMITSEYYVTGGDDGSLSLWSNGRKKPVFVHPNAHGAGKWISSVAVMPRSDLIASGSNDGCIRLWKADVQARTLTPVNTIPQCGFINSLSFDSAGRFLLAGVGQEHRFGRWECMKYAKNGIAIIALPPIEP